MNARRQTPDRYMGPIITIDEFRSWEIRQHILRTETPGKFGYFGTEEVAA